MSAGSFPFYADIFDGYAALSRFFRSSKERTLRVIERMQSHLRRSQRSVFETISFVAQVGERAALPNKPSLSGGRAAPPKTFRKQSFTLG